MKWHLPFLFRRYDPLRFNCWQLVIEVYRTQLGIELNSYTGVDPRDREAVKDVMERGLTEWTECSNEEPFALATMAHSTRPFHVGVSVSKNCILHVAEGCFARIESERTLARNGFPKIKYYRHGQNLSRL